MKEWFDNVACFKGACPGFATTDLRVVRCNGPHALRTRNKLGTLFWQQRAAEIQRPVRKGGVQGYGKDKVYIQLLWYS